MKFLRNVLFISLISIALTLSSCAKPATEGEANASGEKSTLEIVKERGKLVLGVTAGVPGYSAPNDSGKWTGFDVDLGRAVSAAIFGDPDLVEYRPLSAKERFTALQSGEIDMLSRVTTWTASRDGELSLTFCGVNFYDGQGFMVGKDSVIKSLKDLDGATIAVQAGTTTELNLADYFRKNGMEYELITFEKNEQAAAALESGRADAVTSDSSQLYALRSKFKNPDSFKLLPTLVSKEPLGPVVRQGDDQWADIVRWSLLAMINAEELGVTSSNVESMLTSENPSIKRLLGTEGEIGEGFGLDKDWAYKIIKYVGNYGESFDRNLGTGSPLNIARGYNALWTDGGLQYGFPIR
ncbi:amino acid ABC transporter substrate-binding protein [Spirochaeta cellobiosiphila]|uniref:amino acid ABC transporter substrate-binding protein n=1 Tax=Spirochaeta cellobiosiphila TaxID=504483 RepID=UPI0003F8947E|nr:amino acid ABC transporter substrate-binding protein [Spirochaeta cellobiosiphila]